MRLDIYRRPEAGGFYSYLAVPEGKMLPDEVTNVDWEAAERSVDINDNDDHLTQFAIEYPFEQINAKGYAITSVKNLIEISHNL